MDWILWTLLLAVLTAMLVPGIVNGRKRIQYPFLASLVGFYNVLLPLYVMILRKDADPVPGLERVLVMTILCFACAWLGYNLTLEKHSVKEWRFHETRLAIGAAVLTVLGVLAFRSWLGMDDDVARNTGTATVLSFLRNGAAFGFAIAGVLYVRSRKEWLLLLMLPQVWMYLMQMAGVRRTPMGELAVAVLLLLYFAKRWVPPLWLIALGVLAAGFVQYHVGALRAAINRPLAERIEMVTQLEAGEAFTSSGLLEREGFSVELQNAAHYMDAKANTGNYTLGIHFWNQLVFGWVPAQYVGRPFKQSLQVDLPDDALAAGYVKPFGTCETGMAEAFMAFWYLGALVFLLIGMFLRRLWDSAQGRSVVAKVYLIMCTLGACLAFTNQIWSYVNFVTQVVVFTLPVFLMSRVRGTDRFGLRTRSRPARAEVHGSALSAGDAPP